jgi:hypothetical protein
VKLWLRAFVALAFLSACAGQEQKPDEIPQNSTIATVRFECLWEAAIPQDYIITVQALSSARYFSRNPTRPDLPEGQSPFLPDYQIAFTISTANQDRIFKLAEEANYFNGNFDYKKHAMANTGAKTLTYADPAHHFETTYNWSENAAIDQLTRLFTGISATIEHGRKLEFRHRYDKLGLEAELKGMEDEAQNHYLAELQVIAPVLEGIANDSTVLNIARQRARRLLAQAKQEAGVKSVKDAQ